MKKNIALMLSVLMVLSCMLSVSALNASAVAVDISEGLNISETVPNKSLEPSLEDMISCPTIVSLEEEYPGVRVTWTRINGATKYRLYCKTEEERKWTEVTDTTDETAIHIPDRSDVTYYYAVRAIDSQGVECVGFDSLSSSIYYISAPELMSATASEDGITVRWKPVEGVNNYRLFYKEDGGETWKKLTDTDKTEFLHDDFKKDVEYTYTARCLDDEGKNYISTFDTKGIKSELVNTPYIESCSPVKDGIEIDWKPIEGVTKYRVFRKSGEGWAIIGESKTTSFIHRDVINNTNYVYTVRALSNDERSYISEYDKAGYKFTYLDSPTLLDFNDTLKGPAVSWEKVEGAKNYQVFVSVDGAKWKSDKSMITTKNVFTYTNAEYGHKYRFTVKCIDNEGNYLSYHDTTDLSRWYLEPPKLSAKYDDPEVSLSWPAVKGAKGYILFAKGTDKDQFKVVGRTTETSMTYDPGETNYTMQFALRCLDEDGEFASAYRKASVVTSYLVETGSPDSSYTTSCIELNEKDRDLCERICYGEAGSLGFTGMALVAQCIRDTYVKDGYDNIADILKDYGYVGSTATEGNQEAKDAVRFIFDGGGAAVQHRILVFYATDLTKSAFHESQNYICSCGSVKFFDFW